MIREIKVPGLEQVNFKLMIQNNDDVLLSHCRNKRPKYGFVTNFGIVWQSYDDFKKDAEEVCHGFWQLLVIYPDQRVIAPAHADEIYNLRINPYTSQPLS